MHSYMYRIYPLLLVMQPWKIRRVALEKHLIQTTLQKISIAQ